MPAFYILRYDTLPPEKKLQRILQQTQPFSSSKWQKVKTDLFNSLYSYGYLEASIDSVGRDSLHQILYLHTGRKYYWQNIYIRSDELPAYLEQKIYRLHHQPLHFGTWESIMQDIIREYENKGYPFVSVKLDSVTFQNHYISGHVHINKGPYYAFDSLIISGNLKVPYRFLENYLQVKKGTPYQEKIIQKTDKKISQLPFLKLQQPSEVVFGKDYCFIKIYGEKKNANRFSGIAGIMPDNKTGRTLLTGDVALSLIHTLGKAEQLDFNWRHLQKQTQDLKIRFNFPYLFNTPFGIEEDFKLYKRDTSFMDINNKAGVVIRFNGNHQLKFILAHRYISTLPSSVSFVNTDLSYTSYGMGLYFNTTDYLPNPRKGWNIEGNILIGNKSIKQKEWENYIPNNSFQYEIFLDLSRFLPLYRRHVLKTSLQTFYLDYPVLFLSETRRIGGLLSFRGFNEESIFTTAYLLYSLEYRFILDQNSYLSLFYNQCYYERDIVDGYTWDFPYGIGGGVSFDAKAGIFSLFYALGSEQKNPLLLRNGKIHFGFINYF